MKKSISRSFWTRSFVLLLVIHFASGAVAQKKKNRKDCYLYNQCVMVKLKDGSDVPARIASVKSSKQYYVRKIGGNKRGLVHRKFIRPMSEAEIAELKRATMNEAKSR